MVVRQPALPGRQLRRTGSLLSLSAPSASHTCAGSLVLLGALRGQAMALGGSGRAAPLPAVAPPAPTDHGRRCCDPRPEDQA
eukprot:2600937-Heterocapsa_arctica.AAC.1